MILMTPSSSKILQFSLPLLEGLLQTSREKKHGKALPWTQGFSDLDVDGDVDDSSSILY